MTETEYVRIPSSDLQDLMDALSNYRMMLLMPGNAWGQQDIQTMIREHGLLWTDQWWGRNHQHIEPGEQVRWYEAGVREFHPCTVLATHQCGALVQDEECTDWHPWHEIHRLDRLHSQPTFDTSDYEAVAAHMGHQRAKDDSADTRIPG